jgi:hypothetical protein
MDNKLSELSKPFAWAFKDANDVDHASITKKANLYGRHDFQPLYSQEYVSALQHESAVNWEAATSLVAENEELKRALEVKDKRIATQDDYINQQQDRIESLEKKNGDLGKALGTAEKRLATPVRLSESTVMSRRYVVAAIEKAGFTVGDE